MLHFAIYTILWYINTLWIFLFYQFLNFETWASDYRVKKQARGTSHIPMIKLQYVKEPQRATRLTFIISQISKRSRERKWHTRGTPKPTWVVVHLAQKPSVLILADLILAGQS